MTLEKKILSEPIDKFFKISTLLQKKKKLSFYSLCEKDFTKLVSYEEAKIMSQECIFAVRAICQLFQICNWLRFFSCSK